MVLIARNGQLQERAYRTFRMPLVIKEGKRAGYGPGGVAGGGEAIYWKSGLVDSQGRVIYTQRW